MSMRLLCASACPPAFPSAETRFFSRRRGSAIFMLCAAIAAAGCVGPAAERAAAPADRATAPADRLAAPLDESGTPPGADVRTGPSSSADVRSTASPGADARSGLIDDAGRSVRVARPVRRVVSVSPSATELVVALGAAARLIARTDYDTDPRLARLPSLGPTTSPDAEAVFALRPELVIAPRDVGPRTLVAQLEALGVPVYVADVQRVADIFSTARRLGALLGLADRADSLVTALRAGLEAVRRAYRSPRRPTVFYVVWHDPPQTTGPGTFIDEVISAAGARNVFADVRLPWPQVSLEALVRRDPDYIVLPVGTTHTTDPARLRTLPGWRELTAVREGRIIVVESDLFNRPGPRVVEAAQTLGRALHAGATAEVAP